MQRIDFIFSYKPNDGRHELDAYDAAQALMGIARSLSIATHYVLNGEVIKQAPALKRAKIVVIPPKAGSFEFLVPVIQLAEAYPGATSVASGLALGVLGNFLTDLTKYLYRRTTGQSDDIKSAPLKEVMLKRPGDIDAIADAINQDVVHIHRPISENVNNFTINGGNISFGNFNARTRDYAQTQVFSAKPESFAGTVASYNANNSTGRFYVDVLRRTIGFKPGNDYDLTNEEKILLAWSLNEYTNGRAGIITLKGRTVQTKNQAVKQVLIDYVYQGAR